MTEARPERGSEDWWAEIRRLITELAMMPLPASGEALNAWVEEQIEDALLARLAAEERVLTRMEGEEQGTVLAVVKEELARVRDERDAITDRRRGEGAA